MGHLSRTLLFAFLGATANAFPGGPGGAGRGGPGGHGGGGGHRGGPDKGGISTSHDWHRFLDLDLVHPAYPEDFDPDHVEILFYDNFRTYEPGSQPNPDKWKIDIGTQYSDEECTGTPPAQWGTNEVQYYTSSTQNLVITDERELRITPRRPGVVVEPGVPDNLWTSARIETTDDWDFRARSGHRVRIQAAIKLGDAPEEQQLGIWPAFWSLGSAYRGVCDNWPGVGEIDILESVNGIPGAWQVLHCGWWTGPDDRGPCNEPDGIANGPELFTRGEWHLVSLDIDRTNPSGDWEEEKIVWRIDGEIVFTIYGSRVGDRESWEAITSEDHMLLLNVAVGGSFPNKEFLPDNYPYPTDATTGGERSSLWAKYVIVWSTR